MKKERKKSKEWAVRSIYLFIVAISLPSSRTPSEQSSEEINDNANRNSEKRNSSLLFFNKKSFDCSPNKVEEGEEPAEGETLPKQRQRCKRDLWMILFIWYVFPRSLSTAHCSLFKCSGEHHAGEVWQERRFEEEMNKFQTSRDSLWESRLISVATKSFFFGKLSVSLRRLCEKRAREITRLAKLSGFRFGSLSSNVNEATWRYECCKD